MHSGRFLEQYVIIEWDPSQIFPVCYLSMVDDGRASCVFVGKQGCTVYTDRPSSCRAYPMGRGTCQGVDGTLEEKYVLLREPHCQGFVVQEEYAPSSYTVDQGLAVYNRFNDALLPLVQHRRIKEGFRPSRKQLDNYILALYNPDAFRQEMGDNHIGLHRPLSALELQALAGDDEQLLLLGIRWLVQEFFNESI